MLEEIRRNSTLILIGETGSGKTTQIPQLLLQAGLAGTSGCIGITQPRRVAAVSIARRVAEEQGVEPGGLVGYCVRFENVTSPQTRIKYLTDGMMVREAMTDEILSDYSVYYSWHRFIVLLLLDKVDLANRVRRLQHRIHDLNILHYVFSLYYLREERGGFLCFGTNCV